MANVPNVPGVPALASYVASSIVLLTHDIVTLFGLSPGPQWGVFQFGIPALAFNSVLRFEYKRDYPISDYPVEDGGFQSYDKVQLPFDVRLTLVSGSSLAERQALLNSVGAAANSLDLFDVVTPEKVFLSCNITHWDFRRTATNGVGVIVCDVWFEEVRVTATSTFTNTKSPTAQGQQNTGAQQPQAPTRTQQSTYDEAGFAGAASWAGH